MRRGHLPRGGFMVRHRNGAFYAGRWTRGDGTDGVLMGGSWRNAVHFEDTQDAWETCGELLAGDPDGGWTVVRDEY